jgi:hypothetical protein
MTERILTIRELNRATLARQMLLERETLPVPAAIERVAGLQAQVVSPPYVGLWTRLRDFRREDLTNALEERLVVRVAMMRSTLHLMTAEDYLLLRPVLEPALIRALKAFFGKRAEGLDAERLVGAARTWLEEEPRTQGEFRALLSGLEPDQDPAAMSYAVRAYLPMAQVPSGGRWGYSNRPPYALAESWLGCPVSGTQDLRDLVLRYLAAFGPATVADVQAWSGLVRLKDRIRDLAPDLRVFRDEDGKELFDAPDAPLPPPNTPAPVRFVPDYDNLVLSHADRRRVISDEHRKFVFLSAGRVRATFLVDGFVAGTWKVKKSRGAATIVIEPFESLPQDACEALIEEGERLVRFVEGGARAFEVRFA